MGLGLRKARGLGGGICGLFKRVGPLLVASLHGGCGISFPFRQVHKKETEKGHAVGGEEEHAPAHALVGGRQGVGEDGDAALEEGALLG